MFTIQQIEQAHAKVQSGADFPGYIREIKALGVQTFETWVKDSHTEYSGASDYHRASLPMYEALSVADLSNKSQFEQYLRMHQQGATDYPAFCRHCAETGIEKWIADLEAMTCTYYDKAGNTILVENIPQ